ncbi:DUF4192 domain-containing protein [Rathayibacter soli]|uniref:DUF4192 domain-containing protein n=1 Tax=Rathayibacter soli TaxID=3144168 RepID=UPI0027E5AD33|nr:DUF4192 domain-containing protein [Glaciibacter superstes]
MQTIVKTTQPHDLLALVPQLVGFRPQNSLVLVAFDAKRTCGAYRVDLPEPAADAAYKRMATTLIGMLCKVRGADGVVPVIYTDDRFDTCGGIPRETFAMLLLGRARTAGFTVKDALCVAADGWGSYFDESDARDSPRPLAMIDESAVHTSVPEGERVSLRSPRERAELPQSDLARRERVTRAILRLRAQPPPQLSRPGEVGACAEVVEESGSVDTAEELTEFAEFVLQLDGATISPDLAARIILTAELPSFRDVLLFEWAWGREIGLRTCRLNQKHERGEIITPEDDGALGLAGIGMPRPDVGRIGRAIELLGHLAACAPKSARAPLVTMLAWLHWALGSGSTAGRFIAQARAIDPGYGLADLLDSMLQNGMLPEWSFERPKLDPDRRVVTIPSTRWQPSS